ncbi:MAG: hypothetical protein GC190_13200 [Alphaproteobacteria bacterium]|nr:hypothetical protein [Alphaproteobacteria bacterium]
MTDDQFLYIFPIAFPLFFAIVWIGATTLLGFLSGWYALMDQFPDRDEKPIAQLNWQSGFMGSIGVNFRNVLKIGVCPSGLRIGVLRIVGLFARDFFVPWHAITATKKNWWMWQVTEFSFGKPQVGRLMVYGWTADRIAEAAKGNPEVAAALNLPKS